MEMFVLVLRYTHCTVYQINILSATVLQSNIVTNIINSLAGISL